MKIAIVGYGYVGRAYHQIFKDALVYDPYVTDVETVSQDDVNSCDMVLISVPTPTSEDGMSCDTSLVEETLAWLTVQKVLIKSTVRPKTTERLQEQYPDKQIVFSPEFVGEGGYFVQYWKYPHATNPLFHNFQILGGPKEATTFLAEIFIRFVGPHITVYQTDSRTAEIIKYTENMFIATKVTFANEMHEVCKAFDREWVDVREGWVLDERVGRMFTGVFPDKRGYEGKCLPKDTKALVHAAKEQGYTPAFLQEVIASNNRIRKATGFDEV